MGLAGQALASPASVSNDPLATPSGNSLERTFSASIGACLSDAAAVMPSEPGVMTLPDVATPMLDGEVQPGIDMIVGASVNPTPALTPACRVPPKSGPGLRLPSFETLGIAVPHPDRFAGLGFAQDNTFAIKNSTANVSVLPGHWTIPPSIIRRDAAMLTPPNDSDDSAWLPKSSAAMIPVDTPATESSSSIPSQQPADSGFEQLAASFEGQAVIDPTAPLASWVDKIVAELMNNIPASGTTRVLSHALPRPSSNGHIFPTIVEAIHPSDPTSPTEWINVFHAMTGRFDSSEIPVSPPSTPGPAVGGEDYFTRKVFDSAVEVFDYQADRRPLVNSSTRYVVPPSSINVSILERYIPPATPNEYMEMFSIDGQSILTDRLIELSPENGCLVFVYPTKAGAKTFLNKYLGPVIDPTTRSMVIVNEFSHSLSHEMGNMGSVERLKSFDEMEICVRKLCDDLSRRNEGAKQRYGEATRFEVKYASTEKVPLDGDVWARDWWTRQEKQRIRDTISRFAQETEGKRDAKKRLAQATWGKSSHRSEQEERSDIHSDRPRTVTELVQQLVEGVIRKAQSQHKETMEGIEVSVFVIKRSKV